MNRLRWVLVGGVVVAVILAGLLFVRLGTTHSRQTGTSPGGGKKAPVENAARPAVVASAAVKSSSMSPAEWNAKFRGSDDYSKFIASALSAAANGDGRAAWYVGQALSACSYVLRMYKGSADPEAQLQRQLQALPNAPQWAVSDLERKTRRCMRVAQTEPFETLPLRLGGYPADYWIAKALEAGDPLAQEQAAADSIAVISTAREISDADKAKQFAVAESNLKLAVQSGDPDALYFAGMLMADPRYSDSPLNGIAVALAACGLGRDCSAANPENPWSNCVASGSCPAATDYASSIQQSLSPAQYADVYAHAQEIQQAVRDGEWSTVLSALKAKTLR